MNNVLKSINPFDGKRIETHSLMKAKDVLQSINDSQAAFTKWRVFSIGERIFVLPSKVYIYAIFAGISIGFAEIGYFYLFNASNPNGASNANTAIPVILGGTILITMIFSFYIFREAFNYQKIIGTFFIIFGICLVLINNNNN